MNPTICLHCGSPNHRTRTCPLMQTEYFMRKNNKKTTASATPEAPDVSEPQVKTPLLTREPTAGNVTTALTFYGADPRALTLPENMPEGDFLGFGMTIGKAMEFASWRIGDWCNYGKKQYGYKDYEKMAKATGLAEQYLRACSSVAERVPSELRSMHSLDKFRLMLARRNEQETVEKLVERLGDKSNSDLREMSSAARGSGKGDSNLTATEAVELMKRLTDGVLAFTPEKVIVFAGLLTKDDVLQPCRDALWKLAEQLEIATAEADAKADAESTE